MVKRTINDFAYDYKAQKKYEDKAHIYDVNKLQRTKWRLILHRVELLNNATVRDKEMALTLRK